MLFVQFIIKGGGVSSIPTLVATQFFKLVSVLLGYFPEKKIGFGGTKAKTVISDWSNHSRTGNYVIKNDDLDFEVALQKVDIPILAISFQADTFAT